MVACTPPHPQDPSISIRVKSRQNGHSGLLHGTFSYGLGHALPVLDLGPSGYGVCRLSVSRVETVVLGRCLFFRLFFYPEGPCTHVSDTYAPSTNIESTSRPNYVIWEYMDPLGSRL